MHTCILYFHYKMICLRFLSTEVNFDTSVHLKTSMQPMLKAVIHLHKSQKYTVPAFKNKQAKKERKKEYSYPA